MIVKFKPLEFLPILYLTLSFFFIGQLCYGQANSFAKEEKELSRIYSKIFPFYYGDQDSLNYYSDLFAGRISGFIKNNPTTINYNFKLLTQSGAFTIVTTPDSNFRIYSWDTWQGGSMHHYKNIYQFKSEGKVHITDFKPEEGDMGTYFTSVFLLKTNSKTYFIATCMGSESSSYYYELLRIYTISNNTIKDSAQIIKTVNGPTNFLSIEYNANSVYDRVERPIRLIKYDTEKKTISIPIVLEGGKVTDRFINYKFTGEFFEKVMDRKKDFKKK